MRPTVLVWLRHFGCLFCKEQAAQLGAARDELTAAGARLAFVGHGGVAMARDFQSRWMPACAVYTDPSAYTYRALGARSSAVATLAGVGLHGLRALSHGYTQTRILGDAFQNGGILVAMPGDSVAWLHLSRVAGDHPPVDVVLAAVRAAVAGADASAATAEAAAREAELELPPGEGRRPRPRRRRAWEGGDWPVGIHVDAPAVSHEGGCAEVRGSAARPLGTRATTR